MDLSNHLGLIVVGLVILSFALLALYAKAKQQFNRALPILKDIAKDGRVNYLHQQNAAALTGTKVGPKPKSGRPRKSRGGVSRSVGGNKGRGTQEL